MDGSDRMPQRGIPAQETANTVPVALPVQVWQQALDMLGQQRWCDVNHIMMNIHQQVQRYMQQQQQLQQLQPAQAPYDGRNGPSGS